MNLYTLLHDEEIHCNGILMTPKEIILKLQKADTLADSIPQEHQEIVNVPRQAMESKDAFIAWINKFEPTE